MTKIKTHKDLDIWRLAIQLVKNCYKVTQKFPKEEIYGLSLQMRRAAISVPSNISEGAARNSRKEYIHYLYYSLGSLAELETQIIIAVVLGYLEGSDNINEEIKMLRRKLLNFMKYLKPKCNLASSTLFPIYSLSFTAYPIHAFSHYRIPA